MNDAQYITDKTFNIGFRNYYDHSKFAVCRADNDGKNGWVCIGDINRQVGCNAMLGTDYRGLLKL